MYILLIMFNSGPRRSRDLDHRSCEQIKLSLYGETHKSFNHRLYTRVGSPRDKDAVYSD
jgi:hypothetical protein